MYKVYLIRHKKLNCGYIRLLDADTILKSDSIIYTPLRNSLTQHLTSRATPERKEIYKYLSENKLLLDVNQFKRNSGWTEDWHLHLWHEAETEELAKSLAEDLRKELIDQGIQVLNTRIAY